MTRPLVVEHRRLAPRQPAPDPLALIRACLVRLQDVPRESTASMPDMLFHNRRVARQIAEAADRIERTWEPKGAARLAVLALPSAREQRREITAAKGRRVRVVERRSATQLALPW